MTTSSIETSKPLSDWRVKLTEIVVLMMLPVGGFFANRVLENGQSVAVLHERMKSHSEREIHHGAVGAVAFDQIIASIEKQQALRDAGIRRELEDIKRSLAALSKK